MTSSPTRNNTNYGDDGNSTTAATTETVTSTKTTKSIATTKLTNFAIRLHENHYQIENEIQFLQEQIYKLMELDQLFDSLKIDLIRLSQIWYNIETNVLPTYQSHSTSIISSSSSSSSSSTLTTTSVLVPDSDGAVCNDENSATTIANNLTLE